MAIVLARCGDDGPARSLAAKDQPPGAADVLSVVVGDWPRARKYFAEAVEKRPLMAFTFAQDPTWRGDPEIRKSFDALQARMRAADTQ
jgi:hypothetical protein